MVKLHRRVSVIYYVGYFDKNFIALLTIFDLFVKLLKKIELQTELEIVALVTAVGFNSNNQPYVH